jgi:hypothetical protein
MRRKAQTTAAPGSVARGLLSPGLLALALLALAALAGCNKNGGLESAFSGSWRAEGETRLLEGRRVLARLAGQEPVPLVAAAVGVTGRGLRGRALPGGVVWHYVGPIDVLPSLVGDRVGFSGNGIVTVLDVKSGERRFHVPVAGRRLEGMAYDGQHYALLLVDSDDARPDELRIVDARGNTKFLATTMNRVGTPLAVGGLVLIPWSRQYVSAFDIRSGQSVGRLLVRNAIHRVEAASDQLWILGAGASHVDESLLDSVGEAALRLSPPELPGEPIWPIDGSKPRLPRTQPVALWAVPTFDGTARFVKGTYGYGYFEVVVGLDVRTQRVKWTNFFPRSMVGSHANQTGITACLEDGSIWQIRWSDGHAVLVDTLDTRLKGCAVSAVRSEPKGRRSGDLAIQVRQTISGTGAGMAAVHELLLADLARSEAARATHALLAIAQDPVTSSGLAERAASYLAKRRTGANAMMRALRENVPSDVMAQPDTTEGDEAVADDRATETADLDLALQTARKRPPPVAALAEALTAMNVRSAAKVLALQLTLPSIDGSDSQAVLIALGQLGGKKQLPDVRRFFLNFKNGGGDRAMLDALLLAARFLLQHGSEAERILLLEAKSDVLTHPELAKSLEKLPLDQAPPSSPAESSSPSTKTTKAKTSSPAPREYAP